jgi:hypothetical protein
LEHEKVTVTHGLDIGTYAVYFSTLAISVEALITVLD